MFNVDYSEVPKAFETVRLELPFNLLSAIFRIVIVLHATAECQADGRAERRVTLRIPTDRD